LQDNIQKLRETHKTIVSALVKTDTHLNEALSEISSLESGLHDSEKRFVYMQELRDYISVMCDFLNDKAFLMELEENIQQLHEKRALAISERRAADLADESGVIEAAVSAAVSILSKGSSSTCLSAASNAAQAAAAAARGSSNLQPELDEFGRDINMQKRMDLKRREEDRRRRKTQSETKRLASAAKNKDIEKIEGELSTDESDSESTAYVSSRDEFLKAADHVFIDAKEEYSSLRIVKDKFEGWKAQYPSAYRDAHVALSAPSVFSPYVRLELLKWDPLHETTDFFDMDWHKVLFDYGVQDDESPSGSNDSDVVPVLVEKVALPILHHRIERCWDVLSTQGTRKAVEASRMVIGYLPTSSKDLHRLLAAVSSRLTQAVADLSVPAWGSMVTRTVPGASQYAAYRFGVAVRLLKNVCLWKDILADHVVEKLALDELLRGKILPHMKSIILDVHDAITRAERVAAALSEVWPKQNQKLRPFADLVAELGNKLERRHASGISEDETRGLARRLKNILAVLNEYDKARAISKAFHLREAL
jgi:GC-rich sequence DNA-binding factor